MEAGGPARALKFPQNLDEGALPGPILAGWVFWRSLSTIHYPLSTERGWPTIACRWQLWGFADLPPAPRAHHK